MLRNTAGDNFLQDSYDMGKVARDIERLQAQVDWLNTWEQLKDTAIPMRFYEQFSKNLQLDTCVDNKLPFWKRIKAIVGGTRSE